MTEEKIIELAETFGITPNKYKVCIIWKDELLKFAQAIYEEGYEQHRKDILGEELYYG